jgi:hypothetical protein
MAETQPPRADEVPEAHSDWPTLIERAVDDVSHIVRSEAHMFQTSMATTLEAQTSKAAALLISTAVIFSGTLCILCAAILLLHQWLPWWQAFGITGVATLVIGVASKAALGPQPEIKT